MKKLLGAFSLFSSLLSMHVPKTLKLPLSKGEEIIVPSETTFNFGPTLEDAIHSQFKEGRPFLLARIQENQEGPRGRLSRIITLEEASEEPPCSPRILYCDAKQLHETNGIYEWPVGEVRYYLLHKDNQPIPVCKDSSGPEDSFKRLYEACYGSEVDESFITRYLGSFYHRGKEYEKAFSLFKELADSPAYEDGSRASNAYRMGKYLLCGRAKLHEKKSRDVIPALRYLEFAEKEGDGFLQAKVRLVFGKYYGGIYSTNAFNFQKAIENLRIVAEQNVSKVKRHKAQLLLAELYLTQETLSDMHKAEELLSLLDESNEVDEGIKAMAWYELGELHSCFVENSSFETARSWFIKAANQDLNSVARDCSRCYLAEEAMDANEQDPEAIKKSLLAAAKNKRTFVKAFAWHLLAVFHASDGLQPDKKEAENYLNKSADQDESVLIKLIATVQLALNDTHSPEITYETLKKIERQLRRIPAGFYRLRARMLLGRGFRLIGKVSEAEFHFKKAISQDMSLKFKLEGLYQRALLLRDEKKDLRNALNLFHEALNFIKREDRYYRIAEDISLAAVETAILMRDYKKVVKLLNSALESKIFEGELKEHALFLMCQSLIVLNRPEELAQYISQIKDKVRLDNIGALKRLCKAQKALQSKEYDEAEEDFMQLLTYPVFPHCMRACKIFGDYYRDIKKISPLAVDCYEKGIKFCEELDTVPDSLEEVYINLLISFAQLRKEVVGEYETAYSAFSKALERCRKRDDHEKTAYCFYELALMYKDGLYCRRSIGKAKEYLNKARNLTQDAEMKADIQRIFNSMSMKNLQKPRTRGI